MFFARRSKQPDIEAGEVYRRSRGSNVEEIARVSAVWSDSAGIPHVEFDLDIRHRDQGTRDHRTLSLASFFETYSECVTAK